MATREEMCRMINAIEGEDQGWIARLVCGQPARFPDSIVRDIIWYALRHAESNGRRYNGYNSYNGVYVKDEPCTYWLVGDYIVIYLTYDPDFNAEMLTEDMMDDLIIEEV